MKKLFPTLCFFSVVIYTFSNGCTAGSDLWRAGFEVEFPFLGVTHIDPHSRDGFSKEAILEGDHWVLMRDTLDSQVEKAVAKEESAGIWNLEFKTKGNGISLTQADLFKKAIGEIKAVVVIITSKGRRELQSFGAKTFRVSTINAEEFNVVAQIPESMRGKEVKFVFKPSIGKDDEASVMIAVQQVLPQLTFQVPISFVRSLFEHLYILGSHSIVEFFKSTHPKQLHSDRELDGFNLLSDYYIYKFFSIHDRREPGPKGSFPLMSRINFRDMYTHLSPLQQSSFRDEVTRRYAHFEMLDAAYRFSEQEIKDLHYPIERYQNIKKEKEASERKLKEFQAEFGDGDVRTQTLHSLLLTLAPVQGFEPHFEQAQRAIAEKKELLQRVKDKEFRTPLVSRYSQNRFIEGGNGELVPELVHFSVEEVLSSIVEPGFRLDISVEGDTGEAVRMRKETDIFSVPFPGLDLRYSMGVLEYPLEAPGPVAVIEVRSYPRILGDFMLDNMWPFLEAEILYCLGKQKGIPELNERNLTALSALSSFVKPFIDKFKKRAHEVDRGLLTGGVL